MALPGLPGTKQGVIDRARKEDWHSCRDAQGKPLVRKRARRGGGWEYHISLLSQIAQQALGISIEHGTANAASSPSTIAAAPAARPALPAAANDAAHPSQARWTWFDGLNATAKARALEALKAVQQVEALVEAGARKTAAIHTVAAERRIGASTIQTYFAAIVGVPVPDRLAYLAPAYRGGGRATEIDAEALAILEADYLRPEKPSFMACYNRLLELYARPRGITLPCAKTLHNHIKRMERSLKVAKREGREAARRSVPPQRRTVMDLHAMQAVNVDGHTFDVFVKWEDGRIGRPVMVGIQDVYSRKLLAHRIDRTESTLLTRLAFADLFRDHGIPAEAVMDNGRAFASKALTGGAATRFRFKVKDSDPTGVLTALGVRVHWTIPYRGSSKPIERAWRDLCEEVAKHPAVSGAYTGNRPDAKPENYGARAIPIAEFRALVASTIARLNARTGRRTEAARGRSFDETFAASIAVNPVGKATAEHLRMALLEAKDRRCDRQSGAIDLYGNIYWSPAMMDLAGQVMAVRFDPDNLHSEIHVYHRDGRYVGAVPVQERTGFFDQAGAERRHKLEADARRKVRDAEAAHDLLDRERLAALLADDRAPAPTAPAGPIVRPVRHRGQTAAALKPLQQAAPMPAVPDFLDAFAAGAERRLRIIE